MRADYTWVMYPDHWDVTIPLLLFAVCFYTSSFARGSIQAFLYGLGLLIATVAVAIWGRMYLESIFIPVRALKAPLDYPVWGMLIPFGLLILLFSYSNYAARQDFTFKHFIPQAVVWIIAIGCFAIG